MKQTCCDEFAGHLDTGEGGFFWTILGDCWALWSGNDRFMIGRVNYCPFCGAKLEAE